MKHGWASGRRIVPLVGLAAALLLAGDRAFGLEKTAHLEIWNNTPYYLVSISFAGEEEEVWGDNLLDSSLAVKPWESYEIAVPPGYVWIRAIYDFEGTEVEVVEQADFEAGASYEWRISDDALYEAYDTYGYWDEYDTYGYWDEYDTYGYMDDEDTYGYYGY